MTNKKQAFKQTREQQQLWHRIKRYWIMRGYSNKVHAINNMSIDRRG